MKIGIIGANGQLGSELVRQGCIPLFGRLMSSELVTSILHADPDAIINCAAVTDVDGCEDRLFSKAIETNCTQVKRLSDFYQGYLIQISTDYIFDGQNGPYETSDCPNPINVYGWTKLGAELVMQRRQSPYLIVRTTILFSRSENNFVSKIVGQLERGDKVTLYQPDLIGNPTYVPELATELIRVINDGYTGIAHIVGNHWMTRLYFAHLIADIFGFDRENIVSMSGGLSNGAARPVNAGLLCDHNEGRVIYSHKPANGLKELANEKTMA